MYNNEIKIIFDKTLYQEYLEYYFKKNPRRSKAPVDSFMHPSINKWFILMRPAMNLLKQNWKDFTIWTVKKYGLEDLKIENCKMTYKFFYDTKRRHDNDNMTPKFTNDGLVESGLLVDDDYNHVNPLVIEGGYDKIYPRMEIIIEY